MSTVEPQESAGSWGGWPLYVCLLVVAYPLSAGPMMPLVRHGVVPLGVVRVVYTPLAFFDDKPVAGWLMDRYMEQWEGW